MTLTRTTLFTFSYALLLSLVSCTFNPFSHDNELTGSPVGLAGGAVAGVGVTALLGAPKPVIALAGIGGASLGYYVTTLRFASGGVIRAGGQVYTIGDSVAIEIPTDTLFEPNSAELLPEAGPILDSAVMVLQRYPDNNIMISGNTSGFGTQRFERNLSRQRAQRVAGYLGSHGISEFKSQSIDRRRLTYVGYGNYFPIANNIRAASIRENSRIQITAYPSKSQLGIERCQTIFDNIGNTDIPLVQQPRQPLVGSPFTSERFSEQSGNKMSDFKDAYNETPRYTTSDRHSTQQYYRQQSNLKGENWKNYNNISTDFHTPIGARSAKHGGYKGIPNFKDE